MQPLARKCESLAVSALTSRYGDEIDVVAPVDILKQIFKTPYSKSRISVAVHRVGHTLILNSGYVLLHSLNFKRFALLLTGLSAPVNSRSAKNLQA